MSWRSTAAIVLIVMQASLGCRSPGEENDEASTKPATVTNPRPEASLSTVTLTAEAEERLGVRTAPLERRPLPRVRTFGGEIVIPAGGAGRNGAPVLVVGPPRSAAERTRTAGALVAAEQEVERARVQVDAATVALARAETVFRDRAGSARAVDEARTQVALARAALTAAEKQRAMLAGTELEVPPRVWVRVPVYAGDISLVDRHRPADVRRLTAGVSTGRPGSPVSGPLSADPDAATADLFYEVENADQAFRPGEKVFAAIALGAEEDSLVARWSAIVHDVHGGEWIYEQVAPQTFVRRRVQVRFVTDSIAALASGPQAGTPVVVEGATELFATEFGVGR